MSLILQHASNTLNSEVSFYLHWFFGKKVVLCSQCKALWPAARQKQISKIYPTKVNFQEEFYSIPHPEWRQNVTNTTGWLKMPFLLLEEHVPNPQPPTSLSQESFHSSHSSSLDQLFHLSFFHSFQSFPLPEFHSFLEPPLQSFPELPLQSGPLQFSPEFPDQSLSWSKKNSNPFAQRKKPSI